MRVSSGALPIVLLFDGAWAFVPFVSRNFPPPLRNPFAPKDRADSSAEEDGTSSSPAVSFRTVQSDLSKYQSIMEARRSGGLLQQQQVSNRQASQYVKSADRVSFSEVGTVGRGPAEVVRMGSTEIEPESATGTIDSSSAAGEGTLSSDASSSSSSSPTSVGTSAAIADAANQTETLPNRNQSLPTESSSRKSSLYRPVSWSQAVRSRKSLSRNELFLFLLHQYVLLVKGRLNLARLVTMNSFNDCLPSGFTWIEYVENTLGITFELKQEIASMDGTATDIVAVLQPTVELLGKTDGLSPRATRIIKPRPKRRMKAVSAACSSTVETSKTNKRDLFAVRYPPKWAERVPRSTSDSQVMTTEAPIERPNVEAPVDEQSMGVEHAASSAESKTLEQLEANVASDWDSVTDIETDSTSQTRPVQKAVEQETQTAPSIPPPSSSPSIEVDDSSSKPRPINGAQAKEVLASPPLEAAELNVTSQHFLVEPTTPLETKVSISLPHDSVVSGTEPPVAERQDGEPIPAQFRFLGTKYMEELKRAASKNPLLLKDELEKLRVVDDDQDDLAGDH